MEAVQDNRYTYADYRTWDDGERCELIGGEVYMMAPAPSFGHQRISMTIGSQLEVYLRGKKCQVVAAPFDVRLNADTDDDTVVQPDIAVICDGKKLEDGKSCQGAPDMVVEILSPSTARRDQILKFNRYREAGVREYWLVNPETQTVQVNLLKDGEYVNRYYERTDTLKVSVLDDCLIDLSAVFPEPEA